MLDLPDDVRSEHKEKLHEMANWLWENGYAHLAQLVGETGNNA